MKVPESIRKLFELLKDKESANREVSEKEILQVTGWKKSTLVTYFSKDQLSDFLHEVREGAYEASNVAGPTPIQFLQLLSQSKHRRGLGHNCKFRLAKALLKKSRDNMLLALELYNRPSLENRLDSFVFCFCIAWEQLLKAILIEENTEEAIYKGKNKQTGFRRTISLRECLEKLYKPDDLVRRNIEKIVFYRDQAVHLLMPEVQGIMSRVFQSGVLNYTTEFQDFTESSFILPSHSGMISLVGDVRSVSNTALNSIYGKIAGDEISSLINELTEEAANIDDIKFAIPLNVKLIFAKEDDQGNVIHIAKADEGMEGLRNAIVIEKPTERSKTHPYRESNALKEINRRLREEYSEEILSRRLVKLNKDAGMSEVNSHCFRAVVEKLGWKKSDNRYHHQSKDPEYHYFSDAALDEFISKVMSNDGYLEKAKSDYSSKQKKE